MTDTALIADVGATPGSRARREPAHARTVTVIHGLLFAAAVAVAVLTAHTNRWDIRELLILIAFAVTSELTATLLPSGFTNVSGSFLGITLAAVVLGGAEAAIVGVLTIGISWFRWREKLHLLRNNLVTFAWFPLLSGLMFHAIEPSTGGYKEASYYLLVFGTFMVALTLNFTMVAGYECLARGISVANKVTELKPIITAELFSAVLTLVAVYLTKALGVTGLAMVALVLVVFQRLVGELLLSQRRGEELRVAATTDELTGLVNRKEFSDRLDAEIETCKQAGTTFGVLLLDLDHFKDINDTLGHQFGDDLLADLGPRLATRVGERGLVARFGGDEFAVLPARRSDDVIALGQIVQEVLRCVREPVVFKEITLEVDGSIGVARYPENGTDAQTLLRRADIAMYAAKGHGDSFRIFSADQDNHSPSRLSMVSDFRRALERENEIIVHYHPIVDLSTRTVHGAEALVRWQHPTLGLLQPGAFIEVVEQTGLMGPLTTAVLTNAIIKCAAWHAEGRELTVSVNLSVRNLHDPLLPSQVDQLLALHGLPSRFLKLEITESMILSDPERALATVRELGELGVRLAVDDFGTGHSSLANLRMLPVHELKIDRSFVTPMLSDQSDMVIVRSTVDLGHALGLRVIAEGVEDRETLERLASLGCDRAQGHYFSMPVPAEEFISWIPSFERAALTAAESASSGAVAA
jgi:diguanylate cyclase (GGDEF)-like protein